MGLNEGLDDLDGLNGLDEGVDGRDICLNGSVVSGCIISHAYRIDRAYSNIDRDEAADVTLNPTLTASITSATSSLSIVFYAWSDVVGRTYD